MPPPTAPYLTVQQLHDRVLQLLTGGTTADAGLTAEIKWGLYAASYELWDAVLPSGFRSEVSGGNRITLVAGTKTYALVAEFGALIEPSFKFDVAPRTTLREMKEQEYDGLALDMAQLTGTPTRYHLLGRDGTTGLAQVRLIPTPATADAGKTLTYRYFALPAALHSANLSDYVDPRWDPSLQHWIVYGALFYLQNYLRDRADAALYLSQWKEFIRDARARDPRLIGDYQQQAAYPGPRYGVGWPFGSLPAGPP